MIKHKVQVLSVIVLQLFLIPATTAGANSMPPPPEIWLRFVYPNNTAFDIDAIQIVGCSDVNCMSPILLKSYGPCSAPDCITSQPLLSGKWKLECAGNRCLFVADYLEYDLLSPYLHLIIFSANDSWISETVPTPKECYFCTVSWKITIDDKLLSIVEDTEYQSPDQAYGNFFKSFIFSTLIELAVTGILLLIWKRWKNIFAIWLLGVVLSANVLSYPVSWLTIPSFGRFQFDYIRKFGLVAVVVVLVVTLVSLWISIDKPKIKKSTIVKTILIIPVCVVCVLLSLLSSIYGNHEVHVNGLHPSVVIALAEIYAVVFEMLFVYLLCKSEMSLKQTALLTISMNVVSFLFGIIIM